MPSASATAQFKRQAEAALVDPNFDFIAKYHAVSDLRRMARVEPEWLDQETLDAIRALLTAGTFNRVRQSYFLFREAASVMRDMACAPAANGLGDQAVTALKRLLRKTQGTAHRGVAEALGSLPVDVLAPPRVESGPLTPPAIDWQALLSAHGLQPVAEPRYRGRSLVMALDKAHDLLVVKLAQKGDRIEDLQQEIRWMERLRQPAFAVNRRFHVPSPLMVDDQAVFCINRLPLAPPETVVRHPRKLAIAFLAHQDYFVYPNHHHIDGETAREILGRNAYIMGHLAGRGIIHDAPIPLFHNRTQRMRRDDQGRYQWFRAGRLDRWLDSCAFPNIGLSGLRDFEHLEPFGGNSRTLYRQIGSHFLSLLLVAGSHFRCRDRSRKGLDPNGSPVDTRDLFDPPLLEAMIREIFENYHTAFTGTAPAGLPLDLDRLVTRMIEEMGLDRYMGELFRRADQAEISDIQFEDFLKHRGFTAAQLKAVKRAEKDIRIVSGPHLGDFNRQISLPEIIEAVAAMAAVCMAGRFQAGRR